MFIKWRLSFVVLCCVLCMGHISLTTEVGKGSLCWHVTYFDVSCTFKDKSSHRDDKCPEHGRTDCFSLVREQAAVGGSVYSFESQELLHSKLVLSHRIKTTDFPIDFQEHLSYQRKDSIKCVPPLPLHFGELLSQERPHFCFQILGGHRISCIFLWCPGTPALKQKSNDGQIAK